MIDHNRVREAAVDGAGNTLDLRALPTDRAAVPDHAPARGPVKKTST